MRIAAIFLLSAVGIGSANADEPKKNQEKSTNELLGTWEAKKSETSNGTFPFTAHWEFKSDIFRVLVKSLERAKWKYRLNSKKNPKEIDLTPPGGKTVKGIYKVEKDTLTICYVDTSVDGAEKKDRPTSFDPKKRDDVKVITFVRKKR